MQLQVQSDETTPGYYDNPSNLPYLKRAGAKKDLRKNITTVVKTIRQSVTIPSISYAFTINHGLNGIFEFFGRYRPTGATYWYIMDGTETIGIDANKVSLIFPSAPEASVYDFELYFISFRV